MMTKKIILFAMYLFCSIATAQTLQEMSGTMTADTPIVIYTAKEIITMDKAKPKAEAVAVQNGMIIAVGTKDEVGKILGDRKARLDKTFNDKVIVPSFIAQHDHPVLAALTMASEVLSIEDWELPVKVRYDCFIQFLIIPKVLS